MRLFTHPREPKFGFVKHSQEGIRWHWAVTFSVGSPAKEPICYDQLLVMGKTSELLSLLKTGNSDAARRLIAKFKKGGEFFL